MDRNMPGRRMNAKECQRIYRSVVAMMKIDIQHPEGSLPKANPTNCDARQQRPCKANPADSDWVQLCPCGAMYMFAGTYNRQCSSTTIPWTPGSSFRRFKIIFHLCF